MKKTTLTENKRPCDDAIVRYKDMGNIKEIMSSEHRNTICTIQKISSEEYVYKPTGEIKPFQHIESRADDKNSVRKSLGTLRDLINTNVLDVSCCRWVTLTYAENMKDHTRLYRDFKKFVMRMRSRDYKFEYIVAMEPQGRGAWHAHMIMIFETKAPFIPNNELAKIWGHGFVTIKKLENVDNVGAYLTAYLGDMELEEAKNADVDFTHKEIKVIDVEEEGKKVTKAFIKGARLNMYPPKFNIYRCSRGIKKPDVMYITEREARKKVGDATPTFEKTVEITDETSDFHNVLNYRQFNIARGKKQI